MALADIVIINKLDLINEAELQALEQRIVGINSMAKLIKTTRSKVDLDTVLDLNVYKDQTEFKPGLFQPSGDSVGNSPQSHHLDASVITVTVELPGSCNVEKIDGFLQELLWDKSVKNCKDVAMEILRMKAFVCPIESKTPVVFQAVHEIYDKQEVKGKEGASENVDSGSRFIFIGRNLDKEVLEKQLRKCQG